MIDDGSPREGSTDRDDRLWEIAEALQDAARDGAPVSDEELARRFGVEEGEVRRCREAHDAFHSALGADDSGFFLDAIPADDPLPPPRLPEDYELLGELGRGGMGVVYRARQKSLGRVLAVKVLRPGDLGHARTLKRFEKEARLLARLRHPHIVAVHEVGDVDGQVYFTMDLITGSSLADLVREGPLSTSQSVRLLRQVASAVAYTHTHGLIHRDLKPANILIGEDGGAFVTDFGLAQESADSDELTLTGQLLGTPAYMSPEQARGDRERIGEATDVYALGALLYECLTGKRPFQGDSVADVIHAVIHSEPRRPRRLEPRIPPDLEVVTMKAMAKQPEQRYATARALLEDLERFEEGRPIRARRPSLGYRARRFLVRQRALLSGMLVAAAVILAAFVILFQGPMIQARKESDAETLAERGEDNGAAILYEQLLEGAGAESDVARLRERITECRLSASAALREAHRAADAADVIDRTLVFADSHPGDGPWPQRRELLWELAICRALAGDQAEVDRILEDLRRVTADEPEPFRGGVITFTDGVTGSDRQLLDRLDSVLFRDEEPPRGVGVLLLRAYLKQAREAGHFASWLQRHGPRLVARLPMVIEAVALAPTHVLPEAVYGLEDALRALPPDFETELALASVVQDDERPPAARALGASLLAQVSDIPVWVPGVPSRDVAEPLAGDAAEAVFQIKIVWQLVVISDRAEGHRHRVHRAFESLADADLPLRRHLLRWLEWHLGQDLVAPEADWARLANSWMSWWRKHREADPAARLAAALGLTLPLSGSDLTAATRSLAERHDAMERARLHHLLCLVAPEGIRSPVLRDPEETTARGLAARWCGVLADAPVAPTLALLRIDLPSGGGPPLVVGGERASLPHGISLERTWEDRTRARGGVTFATRIPGLGFGWDERPWVGVHQRLEVGASLYDGSDVLTWSLRETRLRPTGASRSTSIDGGRARSARCLGTASYSTDGRPAGLRAFLARWDRVGRESPVDLAAVTTTIVDDLSWCVRAASAPEGFPARELPGLVASLEVLSLVSVPAARSPLRRLSALLERDARGRVVGPLTLARLTCGDTEALDSAEDLEAAARATSRFEDAATEGVLWARLALETEAPRIREHALAALAADRPADDVALALRAAAANREIVLPDIDPEPLSAAGPTRRLAVILAALLVACALVGAVLCFRRRRDTRRGIALFVLTLGVAMTALDVSVAGFEVWPDAAGFLLAAVACLALPTRPSAVALFVGAAVLRLVLVGEGLWPGWLVAAGLVGALGFVALAAPLASTRVATSARVRLLGVVGVGVVAALVLPAPLMILADAALDGAPFAPLDIYRKLPLSWAGTAIAVFLAASRRG